MYKYYSVIRFVKQFSLWYLQFWHEGEFRMFLAVFCGDINTVWWLTVHGAWFDIYSTYKNARWLIFKLSSWNWPHWAPRALIPRPPGVAPYVYHLPLHTWTHKMMAFPRLTHNIGVFTCNFHTRVLKMGFFHTRVKGPKGPLRHAPIKKWKRAPPLPEEKYLPVILL